MPAGRSFTKAALAALLIGVVAAGCTGPEAKKTDRRIERAQAKIERYGCYSCHGDNGLSHHPRFPNLAGQNAVYIQNQLTAFTRVPEPTEDSSRRRKFRFDAMMSIKAKELSPDDIEDLAYFFSTRACGVHRESLVLRPPKLVQERCGNCHGVNGLSPDPAIPNLAGQKRGYLERQLHALRAATDARFDQVMSPQAQDLTDQDITEITTYYSKLPCR